MRDRGFVFDAFTWRLHLWRAGSLGRPVINSAGLRVKHDFGTAGGWCVWPSARRRSMATWMPDPSFYPSPRMAARAPAEGLAYVASFDPQRQRPDEIAVVDVAPSSASYGQIVGHVAMPGAGDELHHFGWNACSSCLCPNAPHPHVERRYLIVTGLRSSRIHVIDTKPDPRNPQIVKVIEPATVAERAGYTRPHTVHCGPDGIYVAALGNAEGKGPGGVFVMDHESFEVLGRWEVDRGPQHFAYDMWWHLGYDTLVTSEWGTPDMFENGLVPELLLGSQYGRKLHFWDLHKRRHLQEIDFGKQHQLIFELRPAHDPTKAYGFVNCVVSLWSRAADPKGGTRLNGGPQMVEVSRDGRRIYFTNSLYSAIDPQFYPDGINGWMAKVNAGPNGGIELDRDFFIDWPAGHLPHQVRLQGGDASSDSYCYP